MKLIETKGKIAEDGSITLPSGVLETMCITTGDTIHLAYLSHHPVKQINSYGEFFLTKEGIDHVDELTEAVEFAELSVPYELLEAAGIEADEDLDIRCENGTIIISSINPTKLPQPQLIKLFDSHGAIHCTLGGVRNEK